MMLNYNKYGEVAIKVGKVKGNPKKNWKTEVKKAFSDSISSQKKSCPKSAFLGLCEEGLVKGIKSGVYLKSNPPSLNKQYAIAAVALLKTNSVLTRNELWVQVRKQFDLGTMSHNSQMDVVLALWENGLIK